MTTPNDCPIYDHDCDKCIYLGHVEHGGKWTEHKGRVDLYFCDAVGNDPTLIGRFGSRGDQYLSGFHNYDAAKYVDYPLREALRLAVAKGLCAQPLDRDALERESLERFRSERCLGDGPSR